MLELERLNKRKGPNIIMKDQIFKLIFSKAGPIVVAGVSFVIGYITTKLDLLYTLLSSYDFIITADVKQTVMYSITGFVWLTVDFLINKYAGNHSQAIQEIIQKIAPEQVVDKWIGNKTVATLQSIVDEKLTK